MDIVAAALTLFFVMDPIGNVPIFLNVLERVDAPRRRMVLTRELLIALVLLVLFFLGGRALLDLLHLQTEAIRVGGGIVLFLIALRMVFPPDRSAYGAKLDGEPMVFPLAVPLIAGPSSFATLLLFAETAPEFKLHGLAAIGCAWGATAIILSASPVLLRIAGRRGLMAMERLMGMLLIMMAVQMVMVGVRSFLSGA